MHASKIAGNRVSEVTAELAFKNPLLEANKKPGGPPCANATWRRTADRRRDTPSFCIVDNPSEQEERVQAFVKEIRPTRTTPEIDSSSDSLTGLDLWQTSRGVEPHVDHVSFVDFADGHGRTGVLRC